MKTSKLYLTVVSLIALLVSNAVAAAWTGSMSEPENMKKIDGKAFYVITTADELAWFADQVNGGKSTVNAVLANDIMFGANTSSRTTQPWTPIGKDDNHTFNGTLDGNGYTIYGLYARNLKFTGLIGVLGSEGLLKNLKLQKGLREKNSAIADDVEIAAFVSHNKGMIQNCFTGDTIFLNESINSENNKYSVNVGAIVGVNEGDLEYDYSDGIIDILTYDVNTTTANLGNCSQRYSDRSTYIGGVVGRNLKTIWYAENKGNIRIRSYGEGYGGYLYGGGVVGLNSGEIKMSKSNGQIDADSKRCANYIGGIAGSNYKNALIEHSINYSSLSLQPTYDNAEGHVGDCSYSCTRISQEGGIAGSNWSKVKNSYSIAPKIEYKRKIDVGAVIGKNQKKTGSVENVYFNSDALTMNSFGSDSGTVSNVAGMTTTNMQKDQFAWILNTTYGKASNDAVWSRTDGYPIFATEQNKAIYKVVFNDDGVMINRYTNYKGLVTFPENPEPAEGFIFKGWYNSEDIKVKPSTIFTADQTVNAVYVEASDVYWTINFFNTDSKMTLLQTKQYQHGSIVSYEGNTPTKEMTAQYTYTFKGWNVEPINAVDDFDYYAVYDSVVRSYTIVFNNFDGSKIESGSFKYGIIPSCSKTPTRTATAEWTYSHKGWKPALDYVTGEATYVATYDSSKVEYKVTFMNGVDVIDEQMVPYGEAAVAPTDVTRDGYKFTGWNTSFSKVTENLTVKALFEELPSYIVKVVDGDIGVKIDSTKVVEGKVYTLPTAPKKTAYTFDAYYDGEKKLGVANDKVSITSNITITAAYKRKIPTLMGNLVQTLTPGDTFKTVIFQGVDTCYRKTSNISFLKVSTGGNFVDIKGIVPVSYKEESIAVDSLLVNTNVYEIKVTIRIPNEPKSSSSKAVSSSSTNVKSSSSKKTDAVIVTDAPKFSMIVQNRLVQISNARVGSAYALFDMQGRVLQKGRVETTNYSIVVPRSRAYFVRIDDQIKKVNVR